MQAAMSAPLREHEQPMSWARALVLATGFFFLAAILIAQIPGYFYTISTLATLAPFEQGTLSLGLLAVGFGGIAMEIAFLYDPKPLFPPELFALAGAVIAAIGGFFLYQVYTGSWHELLPDVTTRNGTTTYWPIANQSYLFNPIWFQVGSIDLIAVGMIGLLIGLGMLTYALLCRPVLAGKLDGPVRDVIVRVCLAFAFGIVAAFITINTFSPNTLYDPHGKTSTAANIALFLALLAALLALQVWILPIMIRHRQQFMPAVYFHGVVGLLGQVGVPLLVLWAAIYPIVYLIRQVDSTQFIVQCSEKTVIPASCTFTQYTGYIVVAIVVGLTFTILMLGLYFWSTRRNTVILAGTIGIVYLGLAATVIHVNDPVQLPVGIFLAACIAILAFGFTWASQREFAELSTAPLGCTGQWLLLGTGVLIYLGGFAIFSMPSFFESEALGLYYQPGPGLLHDAFWAMLLMGGLAVFQFTILTRRDQPMSGLRKFVMWTLLIAVLLEMIGAIQGFHHDLLAGGWNVAEGSHAVFVAGICFEVVGLVTALAGVVRATAWRWGLVVILPLLVGGAGAYVTYVWPGPAELVIFGFIICMLGGFAYAAAGPDWPLLLERPTPAAGADGGLAVGARQ